jgi:hypothetical protein
VETLDATFGLCIAQFGKFWFYVWIEMKVVVITVMTAVAIFAIVVVMIIW